MRGIFLIIILLVNSCASLPVDSPTFKDTSIIKHIDIIEEVTETPILTQKNYSSFYTRKSNFIYTAGVPTERIISILSPINQKYFDGVSRIEFIKTNKFISNSKDGWYYSDSKSI